MKTKDQLIKSSEQYFKGTEVEIMYATSDGNFFHKEGLNYASAHAQTNKLGEVFTITRADYDNMINPQEESSEDQPGDETPPEDTPQDDPQEESSEDQESNTNLDNLKPEDISVEDAKAFMAQSESGKAKSVHKGKVTAAYIEWKKANS